MTSQVLLESRELCKSYPGGVDVLESLSFSVKGGEFLVVHGPSGCGKSTLLLMLGGMMRPCGGEVILSGESLYLKSEAERTRYRARHVGFVFQEAHLIPYLNIEENILAASAVNPELNHAPGRVAELLTKLGLTHRASHRPAQLSAGERQRVALARAMLGSPSLILADEPTGNLDRENRELVMDSLREYTGEGGTVVMVTHDDQTIQETEKKLGL